MTLSTLTMGIAFLLAGASFVCSTILGVALLYVYRGLSTEAEVRDSVSHCRTDLTLLRKEVRAFEELLDTYRKRDANRASQASQRKKREESSDQESTFDVDAFRLSGGIS